MDNITLRKVQLVQLDIAKEIDRLCVQNGIKYFLIGGSLLGAVRHSGFIPWDDDLDIGMLRDDYDKFLILAQSNLNVNYKVVDWKSDKAYPHPMAKITKKGTIYKERKRNDSGDQGIWVDIFPYDNIKDINELKKLTIKLKILRSLVRAKNKYHTWVMQDSFLLNKYIKNLPFRFLSLFMARSKLITKYELLSKKYENDNVDFVFENGTEDYQKWCFSKKYFERLISVKFEDTYFWIPENYHDYLSIAYGDYMTLPPENERKNRHLIDEISFGDNL